MFRISSDRIDGEFLHAEMTDERAGALVVFEGNVRNKNQGKPVRSLEYQVYPELAEKEGARILAEARERFGLIDAKCVHRFGHLALGETAVWIAATAVHRDDAFRATRFIIDQIKLRLPIWKKEHYVDEAPEWVYCRDHFTHVHFAAADYYAQQARVTDRETLAAARVIVIGAGGLGCPALSSLAMAGVGHLTVLDDDFVSLSNLHRQPLFTVSDIGERKATVAAVRLRQMNPLISIDARAERITAENAAEVLRGYTHVLDCTDNLATKFLLHDHCFALRIPFTSASVYRFEGQIRTFQPGGENGCLRCVAGDGIPEDSYVGNCNDFGVLGATVLAIGAMQASEVLQFIQKGTNATLTETAYLNLAELSVMKVRQRAHPDCATCAGRRDSMPTRVNEESLELSIADFDRAEVHLVDVRYADASMLEKFNDGSGKRVVVYCHAGKRSLAMVRKLRADGHRHFYSLKGGACSL